MHQMRSGDVTRSWCEAVVSICFLLSFPVVGVDVMQLSQPRECRTCSMQFANILFEVFCNSLIPRFLFSEEDTGLEHTLCNVWDEAEQLRQCCSRMCPSCRRAELA